MARVGGLAVAVVVAVVLARARAAGLTPPVPGDAGEFFKGLVRIVAIAILTSGILLLLWGPKFVRHRALAGAKARKAALDPANRRRLLIVGLIGLLFGMLMQFLGHAQSPDRPETTGGPPPNSEATQQASEYARQQAPGLAEPDLLQRLLPFAALIVVVALLFLVLRRSSVEQEQQDEDEASEQRAVARAMAAGRAAVRDRTITDPRLAIVACFAAMEEALAGRGGELTPQDADTPEEVLRRGVRRASLPEAAAQALLGLFREARFSEHPITERDRADADAALAELLDALGSRRPQLRQDR